MTEDRVEAVEVSVVVKNGIGKSLEGKNGIKEGLEDKVVNEVEVGLGSKCDVKGNGYLVAIGVGEDECDNSYVLVSGTDLMVEDTTERGNASEAMLAVRDEQVLGEAGFKEEVECLDRGQKDECREVDDTTETVNVNEVLVEVSDQEILGESGVKSLDRGHEYMCGEDGETPVAVENGVSLVSNDVEESHMVDPDKDEMKSDVVEEIEMVDEEAEQGEVVDTLQVEETTEAEYSNKLEDVHITTNGHESQHIICSGAVENGNADIGVPNSYAEEELNSEMEIVESNESEHAKEELEKESSDEYSLDNKVNQDVEVSEEVEKERNDEYSLDKKVNEDAEVSEELKNDSNEESIDKNGTEDDARVKFIGLEQAGGSISMIDESFSGKVIAFQEASFNDEEHKLVTESEVSSDVKGGRKTDSYILVEALDFSTEEQNHSANILPVESNAEFANEDIANKHDDFLSSKISSANINDNKKNNIESDVNSGQTEEFGAGSPSSTKQDEKGLEYQTQVDENESKTTEAEQAMSKDILVDSANQYNKELASEITDVLHSSLVTECANGPSINGNGHDLLDVVEVVELDSESGDGNAPSDNEWPELSYYTARRKISTVSISEVLGTQGSVKRETEEIRLADQDRKVVHHGRPEDDDITSYKKKVFDASLSEDTQNACADSETSKDISNAGESGTWADYNDQLVGISSAPVLSTCSLSHSVHDGVATALNLENGVATSESGSKDYATNLNGKLEASKVEISSEEDSSLTFVESEVDRRPFFFLIKVPRLEDDEIREQIKFAQQKVDEKTRLRDSYKVLIQTKNGICLDFNKEVEAAKLKEKATREQLKAKRKELDAVQAVIDKVNSAMTIEDIDGSIHAMEHKMQHETVPLSEEKELMREIKRLRHFKEQLSSSIGTQEEIQEALDQKDQIKDHLKSLKMELNSIRSDVQSAEIVTTNAKKKCSDEYAELNKLKLEFKAADDVRQEAHMSLVSLRRKLAQKNKFFWMYKDTEKLANEYALSGDKKSLHSLCVNQVERVMELWNTNDQFRNDYIKCNERSTLRRLKTFDGRSLGLNEEPPSIPNKRNDRINHSEMAASNSLSHIPPPPQELKIQVVSSVPEKVVVNKPVTDSSKNMAAKKQSKSRAAVTEMPTAAPSLEITPVSEEEVQKTKEEEEEEEIRKREAIMKEHLQMEERAKALDALERKKRLAERAEARAKLRAKKEAEQREKERVKRLRKKERKKEGNEPPKPDAVKEEPKPPVEKPVTTKKPSHYIKGTKPTTMPINLRNRHKRKMQTWIWICVAAGIAAVLLWFCWYFYYSSEQK